MSTKLVFATHNQNKFDEVKTMVPDTIELLSLNMIGCHDEIPETGNTLEENAQIKANFVTQNYGLDCFADDTGLLINFLNGEPGVYSARYAGNEKNAEANMQKVLRQMQNTTNRSARFETVIALNLRQERHFFKGVVEGEITLKKQGEEGFGYDPIFRPKGFDKTFAELAFQEKNKISHRAKALEKLVHHLKKYTYV
ncbi:non-canonical purine NTP diphosphatase [Allomuricauda sp. d1]|uniref:non-canonical purine NTP diphosphatase n=1 Tax=Allomuricauda sp. d1 TaxID=3136725 RepID=UPI0031DCFD1F